MGDLRNRPKNLCFMSKQQHSPFSVKHSYPVSEWNMEPYEMTHTVTAVSLKSKSTLMGMEISKSNQASHLSRLVVATVGL